MKTSQKYFCEQKWRSRLLLDVSGSPKVKYFSFVGKPMCDFMMVFCCHELFISYYSRDSPHLRFQLVTLTFQGHRKSNASILLESSYVTL